MRKIKRPLLIFIIISLTACILRAQEINKNQIADSVKADHPVNQLLLRSFQSDIISPPSVQYSQENLPPSLSQALSISNTSLSSQFNQQVDVNSPWKQELLRQDKYRTLNIILGAMQGAGTAYLLYEHIRKYGLK